MENGKFALQNALLCVLVGWTIDDLEQPKKVKKPPKGLQRLYEEPMEDDDLINN